MRTIIIWDQCGEEPVCFFVVPGNYSQLEDYIRCRRHKLTGLTLNRVQLCESDRADPVSWHDGRELQLSPVMGAQMPNSHDGRIAKTVRQWSSHSIMRRRTSVSGLIIIVIVAAKINSFTPDTK